MPIPLPTKYLNQCGNGERVHSKFPGQLLLEVTLDYVVAWSMGTVAWNIVDFMDLCALDGFSPVALVSKRDGVTEVVRRIGW